jgi:hypothetical protein
MTPNRFGAFAGLPIGLALGVVLWVAIIRAMVLLCGCRTYNITIIQPDRATITVYSDKTVSPPIDVTAGKLQ